MDQGMVEVWMHEDGQPRITWLPDRGQPGYPGRTYSPGDADLPEDFPREQTMASLMEWGLRRWGP